MRLAWSIAFGRSCYWSAIFIYGPLLVIEGGLSKTTAGLVISASQLTLPLGPVPRQIGAAVLVCGRGDGVFLWAWLLLALSPGCFGTPIRGQLWCACCWRPCVLLGLDGVGGIPFYRAVKPRQRQRMTSVYRTFFESSELLPGFLFMFLLLYFETGIVFIVIGVLSAFLAVLNWKYLPKSM